MNVSERKVDKGFLFRMLFDQDSNSGSRFEFLVQLLIIFNVLFMMFPSPGTFETARWYLELPCTIGEYSENVFLLLFTIEFALRCGTAIRYKRDYFTTQGVWFFIDLLAVFPSLANLYLQSASGPWQAVRVLRVFRIFRLKWLKKTGEVMAQVVYRSREELVGTMIVVLFILLGSSVLLTALEGEHSKDAFNHAWASLWWAVATLTTVGYGDVVPESIWGKIAGGFICLSGVLTFALPTAILGSSFVEVMSESKGKSKQSQLQCPHCGESISPTV